MAPADLTQQARRAMDARAGLARQDMGFALASFVRPVVRGKRMYLEAVKQAWMGGLLTISGPELDAADLGVLLALLFLALLGLHECTSAPGCEVPGLLPYAPEHRQGVNRAEKHQALSLKTTMASICREIGRDPADGRAHTAIRASLRRLASIVVEGQAGEEWATTHLISGGAGRGRGGVEVTLSYRLAWSVLGNGPHARLNMRTWRNLSPVAQVLYHWLCAWRPGLGVCPMIKLDTLAAHVWGGESDGLATRRRQQIRAALAELPAGEWAVKIVGSGKAARAEISRTRVPEYAPNREKPTTARVPAQFPDPHKASTQGVEAGKAGERPPAPVSWRLKRPVTELHGPRAGRQPKDEAREERLSLARLGALAARPRPEHFAGR